jgi:5-methylcytosine-specific restriction endonuclease McrA
MKRDLGLSISRSATAAEKSAYHSARRAILKQDPEWVARRAEKQAEYREKNRVALRVKHAEWREAHPEEWAAIQKKSNAANRLKNNAKQRQRNSAEGRKAFMREYSRLHRTANPGLYRTYDQNRRAAERGAEGVHTNDEWLQTVEAFGGCCAYCGEQKKLTRDHNIPLSRGGSNYIWNIVPACGRCNSRKGAMTGEEFIERLKLEAADAC